MFIRTERSIKDFIQFYPIVSTLVIINIALFLIVDVLPLPVIDVLYGCGIFGYPANSFGQQLFSCGMGFNPAVANGEYWRLLTPIFLHGGLMHVLFNSFATVIFGPALEQMLGKYKFILIYFGAGIIGNVGTYFMDPGMLTPHIGASGAIYGIFGLYVFMVAFRKDLMDPANTQIIMIIFVIGLIMTFLRPGINISAHIFGFIGGFAFGPLVLGNVQPFSPWRNRRRVKDDDSVQFNPNRWKRRRMSQGTIKKIVWIGIGVLIVLGLLGSVGIL